jgi:YggT family protein
MLGQLVSLYSFVVLVAVVLSWIPAARGTQFARFVEAVTEPVFERVRRVVPPMGGFDMSPMIVMIGLQVLRRVLL